MKLTVSVFVLGFSSLVYSEETTTRSKRNVLRKFPADFLFGATTSAYQIEGAWDEDGKTQSIWDKLTHTRPNMIPDGQSGDITADSYHNYKRDVEMMRELGLDSYRFSLSWNRILPSGFSNEVNELGVAFYNNLIDKMLKYNIQPMVTLYHWDLPQRLQDLGGWANPLIVDWFSDYARVIFERFGDRVKFFVTINEPREICYQGYSSGTKAPSIKITGVAEYICAKNLLLAHARVWHTYNDEFRESQGGYTGITISMNVYVPATGSEDDMQAAEDIRQFEWQYCHPIFSATGDWHPVMKYRIAARSLEQGFPRSRLPEFMPEEVEYVKGATDFLAISMYTSNFVYRNASVLVKYPDLSYYNDIYAATFQDTNWSGSASTWLKETPWGLYSLLKLVKKEYNNPPVFIADKGFSTFGGLEDDDRVHFYRSYLYAILDAINEGCDVRGYMAWSLMDNFDWNMGYTERFGLYEVDYEDPARTRTPRKSAFVYKEIIGSRVVDWSYEPPSMTMSIDEGH